MKKLIFLLAVAAGVAGAVGVFLRRKEASELWDSATDTVTSWGEPAATKAEELGDTAAQAADSATSAARKAAKKAKDAAENVVGDESLEGPGVGDERGPAKQPPWAK